MTWAGITRKQLSKPARRRWTQAEYEAHMNRQAAAQVIAAAAPANKYGSEKVRHAGMTFDSKRELRRWLLLADRQARGEIRDLRRQVTFVLAPAVDLGEKRKKAALRYIADFVFVDVATGAQVVADAKGHRTKDYRIKKHLMASVHGLVIQEL